MEDNYGISVLMSVYQKENPIFLRQAIESMINQTRKPDEIVIIEDGRLTDELYQVLDGIGKDYPNRIKRYALEQNQGLGLALKYGVTKCRYSLIARMDTDDLSVEDRLELQEKAFKNNPQLDIVGGHISEFTDNPQNPISERKVPLEHEAIKAYQRRRSAFNHVTVMFKKQAVLDAGNYENGLYMEDDLLWLNMISNCAKLKNLDKVLCYVRVGDGMFDRRGGMRYFNLYKQARKTMLHRGQIGYWDYSYSVMLQFIVAIIPVKLRKFIFIKLLRS